MPDYKSLLYPFLDKHEGYNAAPYQDNNNFETVGHGFNTENGDVQGLLSAHGMDMNKLRSGEQTLDQDTSHQIRDSLIDNHANAIRNALPSFDTLPANKQAALVSKHYQLPKNFQELAPMVDDDSKQLDVMKAMTMQNAKNPGVLKRNLDTAELYGGPLDFASMFKVMSPEQKRQIASTLGKIQNENTRKEVVDKITPYLDTVPKPQPFNRLNKMLSAELPKPEEQ